MRKIKLLVSIALAVACFPFSIQAQQNEPPGNISVTINGNHRIVKYDSLGNYLTEWPVAARINESPGTVVVSPDGEVYININGNHRVIKYDSLGNYVAEWPVEVQHGEQVSGIGLDPITGDLFVTINGNH